MTAGTYKNGNGNEHDDRRTQWYDNKDLFEMLQKLRDDMVSASKEMQDFNHKFERYNGLWEKIKKIETTPCRQEPEIEDIKKVLREFTEEMRFNQRTKEKRTKVIITISLLVGIVGTIIGILSTLGGL